MKNPTPYGARIHIGRIEDKYVLGMLCELFGLVELAEHQIPMLKNPQMNGHKEAVRLFNLGRERVKDDHLVSYKDLAGDLWHIYNYSVRKIPRGQKPTKETPQQKALMSLISIRRGSAVERIARDLVGWYAKNEKAIRLKERNALAALKEVLSTTQGATA